MGRAPCCDKANVKRGPWSPEEDAVLKGYIEKNGTGGNWIVLPQKAGLKRCGKSCRLRWLNYLRPNIKHGEFTEDEDRIILNLFANIGSKWSIIAAQLPGRTDNDIKNYWNTKLKKKLMSINLIPSYQGNHHQPIFSCSILQASSSASSSSSSSSPLSFKGSCNLDGSFTGHNSISFSSSLVSCNSSITVNSGLQRQESIVGPMQTFQIKEGLITFGGEASCSSSDGSSNNQMRPSRDIQHEYRSNCGSNVPDMGVQSHAYSGGEETHQEYMISNGGWDEKQSGFWEENPLDYGLEEIKELISSSSCNSFLFEESKTGERVMYY